MFLIRKMDQKIKIETPALKKTIPINFKVNIYVLHCINVIAECRKGCRESPIVPAVYGVLVG
jgi:hypothetical protein